MKHTKSLSSKHTHLVILNTSATFMSLIIFRAALFGRLQVSAQTCNLLPLRFHPTCSTPCPPTVTSTIPELWDWCWRPCLLNAACWHFVIRQPLLCNLANVYRMWQLFPLPPHTDHHLCSGCKSLETNSDFVTWRKKKKCFSGEEGGGSLVYKLILQFHFKWRY